MRVIYDISSVQPPVFPFFLLVFIALIGIVSLVAWIIMRRAGLRRSSIAYGATMGTAILIGTLSTVINHWIDSARVAEYQGWIDHVDYDTIVGKCSVRKAPVENDPFEMTCILQVGSKEFWCGLGSDNGSVTPDITRMSADSSSRIRLDYAGAVILRIAIEED